MADRQLPAKPSFYAFTLYVAGMNKRSLMAVENLKKICEKHLLGRYSIKVVDLNQNLENVGQEKIISLPTLSKELPLPVKRLIGDLSNMDEVIVSLEIQ